MPRRKFIDKKTATTFTLVHRAQNDPRIHDADAPDMVFKEMGAPNLRQPAAEPAASSAGSAASAVAPARSKVKSRGDLEDEFGLSVRPNEGEAATYGVFYDDSAYDYMQHMRELGASGDAFFVEAGGAKKGKGKEKTMRLEDALRGVELDGGSEAGVSVGSGSVVSRDARDLFGEDLAPSEFVRRTTYQDQQDVPDALAGFQPDMDPRLREVLEALEDEAYVDDDDELFGELAGDGAEVDPVEWEEGAWYEGEGGGVSIGQQYEEDEGWETDDTIKVDNSPRSSKKKTPAPLGDSTHLPAPDSVPESTEEGDDAWLHEFNKFKKDAKVSKAAKATVPSDLTGASALTAGGRRKKRKGALTSTSGYSMTSSALHRTEGLTLLDERFEKIEEEYATEDFPDDASMVSGMSKVSGLSKMSGMSGMSGISRTSEAPQLRSDFDSIMDDFLGGYSMSGKRRVKKGGYQTGLEQLDEIRKGLGPAKVKAQKA